MKKINKKLLVGTIAASLIIGGGTLIPSSAFAHPLSGKGSDSGQMMADEGQRAGFKSGIHMMQEIANILGLDEQTLVDALKEGKTIAEVAQENGITEEELVQQLIEVQSTAIDEKVSEGVLSQEQADQMKADLDERISNMMENEGFQGKMRGHKGRAMGGGLGFFGKEGALEDILDVSRDELKEELSAGKSIAQIAEEKGIDKDELIDEWKDSMTEPMTQFVERQGRLRDK